jgi:3-carboxy-cis,cis-muconate cycloisomerase
VADDGLLDPGLGRASVLTGDDTLTRVLTDVEVAWVRALAVSGVVEPGSAEAAVAAMRETRVDAAALAVDSEGGGNPVIPLVRLLRSAVREHDEDVARLVHRGLTSQDVLDTALMVLARDVLAVVASDLRRAADGAARLARDHRTTPMVGRTLTQSAVPTTFGLRSAQWLLALVDLIERVTDERTVLPVQCGGAAGTRSALHELAGPRTEGVVDAFADDLGLSRPDPPWHTRRSPVTRLGDLLVSVTDAFGAVASDILVMARPEIGEVAEPSAPGRGGSSAMPHKRNPVLSVLLRSHALQAPTLATQLHVSASLAVDDRPAGPWHAEWPALRRLLTLAAASASIGAELLEGLDVDAAAMTRNLSAASPLVLAERIVPRMVDLLGREGEDLGRRLLDRAAQGEDLRTLVREAVTSELLTDAGLDDLLDPTAYLGQSGDLVDRALRHHRGAEAGWSARPDTATGEVPHERPKS